MIGSLPKSFPVGGGMQDSPAFNPESKRSEIGSWPRRGIDFSDNGGSATHPFRVIKSDANKVSVVFGQVNSITPTIGGTAIGTDPAPELTISTSGVVHIAAVLDSDGVVTAVTIQGAASLPADDATHAYLTLATVSFSGGSITGLNQSVTHSLMLRRCGVSDMHFWGV